MAQLSDEQLAAIFDKALQGTAGSKAGVHQFVDKSDGKTKAYQVDEKGNLVTGDDGLPKIVTLSAGAAATKPVVAGRGATLYDDNGNPIGGGQTSYPVSPGSSVYTPGSNGAPASFTQAPPAPKPLDSPAQTANAAAATSNAASEATNANTTATTAPVNAAANITNAQTGLINAKISELANNEKLTEEQRKAQFDTWWKINIELPQAQETAALARQKYADEEGNKAVSRSVFAENARTIGNSAWRAAVNAPAFVHGDLAAPGYGADYGNLNGVYQARAMAALKDISPVANAVWNAQFNGGQGLGVPSVPAPAVLPGGGPDPMQAGTPISDAVGADPVALARQLAAQAAARKAAMVPYVPVDNNASRSYAAA